MATMALNKRNPRKGSTRRLRRRSITPDMTALVDIALLLLMFFIVSTSFNTPVVMEMTMPQGETPVSLSKVVSVVIQPNGLLECSYGDTKVKVAPDQLAGLIADASSLFHEIPIIAVDAGNTVRYGLVVDVLDELALVGATVLPVRNSAVVLNSTAVAN